VNKNIIVKIIMLSAFFIPRINGMHQQDEKLVPCLDPKASQEERNLQHCIQFRNYIRKQEARRTPEEREARIRRARAVARRRARSRKEERKEVL